MIRHTVTAALAALAPIAAQAQDAPTPPQQVLVMLAHPDDELFMAPAIAALTRQGAGVTIYHATRGEAGPGVSGLAPGIELADRRSEEAVCAAFALGASHMQVNDNQSDGKLGVAAHLDGSLARQLAESAQRLLDIYDLVLTWGPDGGYGHADHRLVSALTTEVVQAMPAADRPKLLYVGIPAGSLPPVPEMAQWATTDPALLTEAIPYSPADLDAANAAAACHVTQFDEASRAGMMPLFDATMWRGKVHFRPAF